MLGCLGRADINVAEQFVSVWCLCCFWGMKLGLFSVLPVCLLSFWRHLDGSQSCRKLFAIFPRAGRFVLHFSHDKPP